MAAFSLIGIPARSAEKTPPEPPPIKALLVTGGCSHDYAIRQEILVRGIRERLARRIEWKVHRQGEGESDVRIPLFESSEWAKGYDIVVHDHCFPRVKDAAYVDRILAPHRAGLPAVLLHGTMMSFRTGDDRWFEFTGVTTRSHERERAVLVEPLAPGDPILKGFKPWSIPREELYRVEKVWPGTTSLTRSVDPAGSPHVNAWTRRYGSAQTRVFGTTLGNETITLRDPILLDLIARGMLWALGDTGESSFVVVPPGQSLKDLPIVIPGKPLLRPGWNPARLGKASGFAWGADAESVSASLAIDGNPATAWVPGKPGPGSWEVILDRQQPLGAAAIFWHGTAPPEVRLEGSVDGLTWTSLGDLVPGTNPDAIDLVRFQADKVSRLRLSVPRTMPGLGFGLREFAVYHEEQEIPSAILGALPQPSKTSHFKPAGSAGILRHFEPNPDWKVLGEGVLPGPETASQLIPTAAGSLFISVFPSAESEAGKGGAVYRLSTNSEGGLDAMPFLGGLDPGTQIAWDGEWLYTLSGPELKKVRRALGPGPADERFRLGDVYSLPEAGSPRGLTLSRLRLGNDGWLYALASAESEGVILNANGESVLLPRRAVVRFRRDGHGLSVCLRSGGKETDYRWKAPGEIVWASRKDLMEGLGRGDGVFEVERDGQAAWLAVSDEEGIHVACLAPVDAEFLPAPVWNEIHPAALVDFIAVAARPSVLREGSLELLRRKRDPGADLERLLAAGPSPEVAEALVTVISGLNPDRSLPWLVRLAGSTEPALQAPAFLALGDHPGAVDHPVFSELGKSTVPSVSAAILESLRRSRSSLPGSVEVAFGLTTHADPRLAETARRFLLDRGASEVAFASLDNSERRGEWPGAFAILESQRGGKVVDALISRIDTTPDAGFRISALRSLCALYYVDADSRRTWEASPRIKIALGKALRDHRVSRSSLLGAMREFGLPEPDAETLFEIARRDPSFEAAAVEVLLGNEKAPTADERAWLLTLFSDSSRDGDLRLKSLAILACHAGAEEYRRWFSETARLGEIPSLAGTDDLVRDRWLSRKDHGPNLTWLLEQSKGKDGAVRRLSWETLLTHADAGAASETDRLAIWKKVEADAKGSGDSVHALTSAISSIPLASAGKVIAAFAGHTDPATREEVSKRARERGLDPRTGKTLILAADLEAKALADSLGPTPDDQAEGRRLFRLLNCGGCHNIHGEGPTLAPDLAAAVSTLSPSELVEALRNPGKRIAPGYEARLFETVDGRVLSGWVESRGEGIALRDHAGNELALKPIEIVRDEPVPSGNSGCPGANRLDTNHFSALLGYLRTLPL